MEEETVLAVVIIARVVIAAIILATDLAVILANNNSSFQRLQRASYACFPSLPFPSPSTLFPLTIKKAMRV